MKDAEAYLGVTRRTLYRYIESGELPAIKNVMTGRIMFEQDDLTRVRDKRDEWVPVSATAKEKKRKKKG